MTSEIKKRQEVLPIMTMNAMQSLNLTEHIDAEKMAKFLNQVQATYYQEVPYHNDLHGADVMQMTYSFMTQGQLIDTCLLSELDQISMLIAATCHDLGHDGFKNEYHVNSITSRAIDSNDLAIQEHYHASQLFKILSGPQLNFLEKLSRLEFIHFRKRVTGLILGTDMARHFEKVKTMDNIVSVFEIKGNQDLKKHFQDMKEEEGHELELFKNQ